MLACIGLLGNVGCGYGATVTLRDGTERRGRTVGNDETRIILGERGRRIVICKRAVEDVDHAGNGAAFTGLAVFTAGAALLATPELVGDGGGGNLGFDYRFAAVLLMAGGAALGLSGLRIWHGSTERTGWPPPDDALQKPCEPYVRVAD